MARIKQTGRWMEQSRKGSQYWSGMSSDVKGWCIFTRSGGFYLKETNSTSNGLGNMVQTKTGVRTAHRFGPFDSFEAAKAAAVIMCDIDKGDSK